MDWLKQKGFEIVTLAEANLRGAADNKIADSLSKTTWQS